jgi:hypothetical protein
MRQKCKKKCVEDWPKMGILYPVKRLFRVSGRKTEG